MYEMDTNGYVGPPRLVNSEVIVPSSDTRGKHCTLRIKVDDKGVSAEYDVLLPPSTLDTVIASFEKIKNQLQLLAEKQEDS